MNQELRNRRAIDLDELERQLRLGSQPEPRPKPPAADPLAELARIVGQDDPFREMFRAERPAAAAPVQPAAASVRQPAFDEQLQAELRPAFVPGPVPAAAYAPAQAAHAGEAVYASEFEDVQGQVLRQAPPQPQPAARRVARGRGLAVMGGVMSVAVIGVLAVLGMRATGTVKPSEIPVIAAKPGPAKERPENPGGTVVPNQNKEIYRAATEKPDAADAKVVNTVEQPIDLATAPRRDTPRVVFPSPGGTATLPPATSPNAAGVPQSIAALAAQATGAPMPPAETSAIAAPGEPKRVRSIPIRVNDPAELPAQAAAAPSGPAVAAAPTAPAASAPVATGDAALPTASVPLPPAAPSRSSVLAAVASPQERGSGAQNSSTPVPSAPVAPARPPARAEAPRPANANAPLQLVPSRQQLNRRVASAAPAPEATASAAASGWTVQLASRPNEADASQAAQLLGSRYRTPLEGTAPRVVSGQAGGKTVFRVRVGSWSREKATEVCGKIKSAGGSCFVSKG